MRRTIFVFPFVVMVAGCQNFMSPQIVVPNNCKPSEPSSLCFLHNLSDEYVDYNRGAEKANAWTNGTILGATGGAVIGAAVDAHSDLYKAAGGIVLAAMGLSKYGNYANQSLVTRVALGKLICAQAPLEYLLRASGDLTDRANAKAEFAPKPNRMLKLDTSGANVAFLSKSGASIATQIPKEDYIELGKLVSSYDAAISNVDKAERIKSQINSIAMASLNKLQDSVLQQIQTNSFKVDDALVVIKSPAPFNPSSDAKASYVESKAIEDNRLATEMINNYNMLASCLKDDFVPIDFE
ncbi:TPA: hypothetical protein ACKP9S_003583 [Pseudomonas aeruginosa]